MEKKTIYFAINEFNDLEGHFDLQGVYFSEEDLLKDLKGIKKNGYKIYSTDNSCFVSKEYEIGIVSGKFIECKIKDFEEKLKNKEEYEEYLRLKKKFEKE